MCGSGNSCWGSTAVFNSRHWKEAVNKKEAVFIGLMCLIEAVHDYKEQFIACFVHLHCISVSLTHQS